MYEKIFSFEPLPVQEPAKRFVPAVVSPGLLATATGGAMQAIVTIEVQVAFAIGVARPVSVMVETFGTSEVDPDKLPGLVQEIFDLRPAAIIERLDLRRPIYRNTAAYGHFGRSDRDFTWERTDHAEDLKKAAEAIA